MLAWRFSYLFCSREMADTIIDSYLCMFNPRFSVQWKFAFLSLGRPEYLQDSDVVSSRFQVCIPTCFYNNEWRHLFFLLMELLSALILEKRCLWGLGAIFRTRALWQCSKKSLLSQSGKMVFKFYCEFVWCLLKGWYVVFVLMDVRL